MSLLGRSLFVLLLAGSGIGCSSSNPSSAGAPTQVSSRTTTEGKFAQYLLSPRGDIDGAVLEDGTVARFPPHAIAPDATSLRRGDAIRVEGEATKGPGGTVFANASVTKGDVIIARADAPPPPPPGPPGPGGPRGPGPGRPGPGGRPGPPDADLAAMSATGTIRGFSTDPRGNVDGILLSDGTTARAGRKARLETLGLKPGDTVTVTGRGGAYPQGKSLRIETIKLPSGEVRTVERPRAELLPTAHEGVVSTVLVNPHGDVDGLLLTDGSLIRMPPTPRSPQLVAGAKVRGEGDGTSTRVEARTLTIGGSSAPIGVGAGAPPAPPAALPSIEDTSTVAKVVTTPEDDVDTLVLADGAIIRLPPALRDDAAGAIAVGTKLTASGEGGTYGDVKAIHATRIVLASGQSFAEPAPPAPPGVAP